MDFFVVSLKKDLRGGGAWGVGCRKIFSFIITFHVKIQTQQRAAETTVFFRAAPRAF
jgi:hypothetical protein